MPELAFDTSEAFTLITQLLECLFFQFLASVALISWFCVQALWHLEHYINILLEKFHFSLAKVDDLVTQSY